MYRKFTSSYLKFIGENLMTCRNKKENMVLLSSTEIEYRALYHGITEISWLEIIFNELDFGLKKSMTSFCNNIVAIETIINLV